MKKLGYLLKKLRTKQSLSLADVAERTSISRSTVWKAELGHTTLKGHHLREIALQGLRLSESSTEWRDIQAAWMSEKTAQAVSPSDYSSTITQSRNAHAKRLGKIIKQIDSLPPELLDDLEKAVQRPAVLQAIRSLNALYERKG